MLCCALLVTVPSCALVFSPSLCLLVHTVFSPCAVITQCMICAKCERVICAKCEHCSFSVDHAVFVLCAFTQVP